MRKCAFGLLGYEPGVCRSRHFTCVSEAGVMTVSHSETEGVATVAGSKCDNMPLSLYHALVFSPSS
jgi:hypothetical protein